MILTGFSIKNYRSIIDSGWITISNDNITAVIGQNESGKTSILEALRSFRDGEITDDILRSDLTIPRVSCSFQRQEENFVAHLQSQQLPEGLKELLENITSIQFTRVWNEDKSSQVEISQPEIKDFHDKLEREVIEIEEVLEQKTSDIIRDYQALLSILEQSSREKDELAAVRERLIRTLQDTRKSIEKARDFTRKSKMQEDLLSLQLRLDTLNEQIEQLNGTISTTRQEIASLDNSYRLSVDYRSTLDQHRTAMTALEDCRSGINETTRLLDRSFNEKDRKALQSRLNLLFDNQLRAVSHAEQTANELFIARYKLREAWEGYSPEAGPREALEKHLSTYTRDEIARELFSLLPRFEFFEDFSSLLPNRIDLDDVVNENSSAEGYRAARNFLLVAGLEPDFFLRKNDRILKQKIEKLNHEISVDFQEYWSQQIGKNNKIKINFELEHHDYSNPTKIGKPYLEFWIKDEKERLYPKQRSRGVRWFISFYLELKAISQAKGNNDILLIDEPGVSLHARAQEDVLKVFENTRERIQIMYTTHSPHLINLDKLYRILAVQRAIEDDYTSESIILGANSLKSASDDTLSPVYALMGTRFSSQGIIQKNGNVIVPDMVTYYYLTAFALLLERNGQYHFIPANDVGHVHVFANIFTGWRCDFKVFLLDNSDEKRVFDELSTTYSHDSSSKNQFFMVRGTGYIEDFFSTLDFKKLVIHTREGITELNSEYINNKGLSRSMLASTFLSAVQAGTISLSMLDKESIANIRAIPILN